VGEFLEIRPSHGEFHICVGEFLTYGWANFQGRFWVGEFSHVGGRISHTLMGELSGSRFFGRIFHISTIVGEFSHVGGRISDTLVGEFSESGGRIFRVDFGWANFSHLNNSGRIFTRRWANFQGQFWGWAIFSHLKNSGRFFSMGDFSTSQKQWANFSHEGGRISHSWVGEFSGSILCGRFFYISKIVGDFLTFC